MILAVTGHRPDKCGGYTDAAERRLVAFARTQLKLHPAEKIVTGMAQGWDLAIAEACTELSIPFVAAVPIECQEKVWPQKAQERYRRLLAKAAEVHVVWRGTYIPQVMQIRNEWMCDHANKLLALHNNSRGGTANCVDYARSIGIPIVNCWAEWEKFNG